jgi:hypothetical protein
VVPIGRKGERTSVLKGIINNWGQFNEILSQNILGYHFSTSLCLCEPASTQISPADADVVYIQISVRVGLEYALRTSADGIENLWFV